MIYEFFRVTEANDSIENYADLFTICLRIDDFQEFDSKWDGILLSMTKIPPDDILEGLYKLRIRESEKLKTVLELYDLEIHQKKAGPDYRRLKTMVKRSIEQDLRNSRSPRGKSPSGRMSRWPCKDYLKRTCTNSFCEKWHPPECLFYKTKSGCQFGEKCSYAHRQVDEQPSKTSKKNDDKSAVAMLKKNVWHENVREPVVNHAEGHDRSGRLDKKRDHELKRGPTGRRSSNARQLGCVFQDIKPPKSVLRKSSDMQKPIQCVKFTKAIARHTKIRDQNPSLGKI